MKGRKNHQQPECVMCFDGESLTVHEEGEPSAWITMDRRDTIAVEE